MGLFSKLFSSKLPIPRNNNISESFNIPEPTKSLLFVTHEDPSKIQSAFSIEINISLTNEGFEQSINDGKNFYREPSTIWTKLPIMKNNWVEEESMYFPSYSGLSPEHRCQYLMWLQDITKPTNLSYVFLYYYGLERQLLSDNFESAFHEISRLLKFHNKKSFRSYAEMALIVSSLFWKRFDLIEQNPFLYDGVSNEELIIRKYIGAGLTSKDLMLLANSLKLKNRRYIKLYPEDFEMELEKLKVEYEMKNNYILECVDMADLKNKNSIAFANYSLKDTVRAIKIPNLITNPKFKKICLSLLKNAHDNLKISRSKK